MMDRNLALEMVRVTEAAAISAARLVGKGDEKAADKAAVEAMRTRLGNMDFCGTVVIGEGERDEAPMLYIGEKLGTAKFPELDIAVDPLEGTTITAKGLSNATSVIAIGEKGSLLNAPDTYMDKIAVGPKSRGAIDITKGATWNLKEISKAQDCDISDLTVVILDRPRHEELIREVRESGARIFLIGDGDVSGAISTCREHGQSGIDVLMGIGGAPEGVISAAALLCMDGEIQGILKPRNEKEIRRFKDMGIKDHTKPLKMEELAKGDVMFAATGVTQGPFLKGVRFHQRGMAATESVVMRSRTKTIRFINAIHHLEKKPKC